MRIGILIIGSLYWDPSRVRCRWRQERLNCSHQRVVTAPIRYGKRTRKRGNTYTMVFARSADLGTALVVPTITACTSPEHLLREAECLWAAERDVEQIEGICASWGKVCILKNPGMDENHPILHSWFNRISDPGSGYSALLKAEGEEPVLDAGGGLALFEWPEDVATKSELADFDLLLMTANQATLDLGRYPTVEEIASAWRADPGHNVMYFYNNRHSGITTFEDNAIQAILRGDPPTTTTLPTGPSKP